MRASLTIAGETLMPVDIVRAVEGLTGVLVGDGAWLSEDLDAAQGLPPTAPLTPEERWHAMARQLPLAILEGRIVAWSDEMYTAAMRGAESFRNLPYPDSIYEDRPCEFWWMPLLPMDADATRFFKVPAESYTIGIFFPSPIGSHILRTLMPIVIFIWSGVDDHPIRVRVLPALDRGRLTTTKQQAGIAALWEFMRLPFVQAEQRHLERPERRRRARANQPLPDVRVVCLRRSEGHRRPGEGGRGYDHRWLVGGHWRSRSGRGTRPSYVRPHVKGPADKPFLPPRRTINLVVR